MISFKQILLALALFACIVGAIGGFFLSIYHKEYVIGGCIVVITGMAVPTMKRVLDYLTT